MVLRKGVQRAKPRTSIKRAPGSLNCSLPVDAITPPSKRAFMPENGHRKILHIAR